jgi:nucleotide-binding universal stress UspA family protein
MKRILVPLELSTFSAEAFRIATEIAKQKNGTIIFLLIPNEPLESEKHYFNENANSEAITNDIYDFRQTMAYLAAENINLEIHYCPLGDINCLTNLIEPEKIDLIVLASKTTSKFEQNNSLSKLVCTVIQNSNVPVIAVEDLSNCLDFETYDQNTEFLNEDLIDYVYLNTLNESYKPNILLLRYKSLYSIYIYMPLMKRIEEIAQKNVLFRMFSILKIKHFA